MPATTQEPSRQTTRDSTNWVRSDRAVRQQR
jgi:hypothetical protein